MSFGMFLDPETNRYTDDHLIGKAFESLRAEFGPVLPSDFVGRQWNRAKIILHVEGRSTDAVVRALRPFAEAECDPRFLIERNRRESARKWRDSNPEMARLIEKGML